jgi:hypothetical protein
VESFYRWARRLSRRRRKDRRERLRKCLICNEVAFDGRRRSSGQKSEVNDLTLFGGRQFDLTTLIEVNGSRQGRTTMEAKCDNMN